MRRRGGLVIALGSALGLAIAVYNYLVPVGFLSPYSNTAGTLGALVPIASTIIMLGAGLLLAARPRVTALTVFLIAGCLLDIVGTGLAAVLLDSRPLLAAMVVCGVGWLMWVFGRRPAAVPQGAPT